MTHVVGNLALATRSVCQ